MSVYIINDTRLGLIQEKQRELIKLFINDDVLQLLNRYHEYPLEFIPNTMLQKLLLLAINYSAVSQPLTSVPTLSGAISVLTNTLTKKNPLLYEVKSGTPTVCLLKTSNDIEFTATTSEIINEVVVGLVYLNKLNSGYFKFIYGAFGGGPLTNKLNLAQSCNGVNNDVFYSFEEKVDGKDLASWLSEYQDDTEYIKLYYQLIKAMGEASSVGVNDFNINEGNIVVREVPVQVKIIGTEANFTTNFIPCIVNFLRASFTPQKVIASETDIKNIKNIFLSRLNLQGRAYKFITEYPKQGYTLTKDLIQLING
jgi:hypothetical protein